jgi:hypothetical protein
MQNLFISITGNQITAIFLVYLFSILYGIYRLVELKTSRMNKVILFITLVRSPNLVLDYYSYEITKVTKAFVELIIFPKPLSRQLK